MTSTDWSGSASSAATQSPLMMVSSQPLLRGERETSASERTDGILYSLIRLLGTERDDAMVTEDGYQRLKALEKKPKPSREGTATVNSSDVE